MRGDNKTITTTDSSAIGSFDPADLRTLGDLVFNDEAFYDE